MQLKLLELLAIFQDGGQLLSEQPRFGTKESKGVHAVETHAQQSKMREIKLNARKNHN